MDSASVADLIRDARKRQGLSQAALGRLAGVPQSHVAKIESGADVRVSTLLRLLAALGLKLEARADLQAAIRKPPRGSKLAAAKAFGVDLGQLYANYRMTPAQRLELAEANSRGLEELLK
jgi:transcriptional regulator with XRE-family HTH domain